ncbi:MAG: D-alanine--D-alanine ligase family protein, partial [Acidimicrobiales bacterium]
MTADSDDGRDGRQVLVILYGGQSPEHEVSCISARHVLAAADPRRYDVRLVGITSEGRWVDAGAAAAALQPGDAALPSPDTVAPALGSGPPALTPAPDAASGPAGLIPWVRADAGRRPVIFPVLHGPRGEDGTVQGLLELAGLPYVGAGHLGSAAAMDKGITKALLAQAGVPQLRYLCVRDHQVDPLLAKTVEAELGWPVFVKPANLGSSIGVSRATNAASFATAVELARSYDEYVMIEEATDGREIEVAVLGWPELEVSVPGEILPTHGAYDFDDKYYAGTARLV